jgi:hypothetical protein
MVSLYGWQFVRKDSDENAALTQPALAVKQADDGALTIAASGAFGTYLDLEANSKNEGALITKYRDMALHPECDSAVEEIVNEAITTEEDVTVKINLNKVKLPDSAKKKISDSFDEILNLLMFHDQGYNIFHRWYTDGRLFYQILIDPLNPTNGIADVRYIDPRKIKKIREIAKKRGKGSEVAGEGAELTRVINEYYIYNEKGFAMRNGASSTTGLRVAADTIVYVTSGVTDTNGVTVLSYLHRAIRTLNQLRAIEDAALIYKLTRSIDRRVWYIDVGNLPKMKAEQYVRDIMVKQKNKVVYDASTGEVRDDRRFQTMQEDYFLPRREGGRGTEVTNLQGGQGFENMDSVDYFKQQLYMSLRVPVNRLNPDNPFTTGGATITTRDEIKFAKFIDRLRTQFSHLFAELLKRHMVLKGIIKIEDWDEIKHQIKFDFARDSYFLELKDNDILQNRAQVAQLMDPYVGKIFSHEYMRTNIWKQTEEEQKEEDKRIKEELKNPVLNPPMLDGEPVPGMDNGMGDPSDGMDSIPAAEDQQPLDSGGPRGKEAKSPEKANKTYERLKKPAKGK